MSTVMAFHARQPEAIAFHLSIHSQSDQRYFRAAENPEWSKPRSQAAIDVKRTA